MKPQHTAIPFFTDNDVDDALGRYLEAAGHQVTRLRQVMLTDSPDPVVAAACREAGWVLITHNVRHFKALSQRLVHKTGKPDTLRRIEMECHHVASVARMKIALPTIEFEWSPIREPTQGMRIVLGDNQIKVCK